MKKLYFYSLLLLISAFLIRCGGNPEQDGDTAFAQQKYNQALSYYLQVKKSDPNNAKINEKVALAYMYKGWQLFSKTKNIDSFAGNFEKGENFIPEAETSPDFDKKYSAVLFELAKAYHAAKPSNEIQREQYFKHTLDYLDLALSYDAQNAEAEKTLNDIKVKNFEQTYQKGLDFFNKAKKEKNPDLFLSAQHYLERAVSFDPENADAIKSLKAVRAKTVSILNMDSPFPIAIADHKFFKGHFLIALTAMNMSSESLDFDPAKAKLVDADGNEFAVSIEFTEKFDDGITKPVTLEPRKQLDGTLAFEANKNKKFESLSYMLNDKVTVKKYLP